MDYEPGVFLRNNLCNATRASFEHQPGTEQKPESPGSKTDRERIKCRQISLIVNR